MQIFFFLFISIILSFASDQTSLRDVKLTVNNKGFELRYKNKIFAKSKFPELFCYEETKGKAYSSALAEKNGNNVKLNFGNAGYITIEIKEGDYGYYKEYIFEIKDFKINENLCRQPFLMEIYDFRFEKTGAYDIVNKRFVGCPNCYKPVQLDKNTPDPVLKALPLHRAIQCSIDLPAYVCSTTPLAYVENNVAFKDMKKLKLTKEFLKGKSAALIVTTKANYYNAVENFIKRHNLPFVKRNGKWIKEADVTGESYLFFVTWRESLSTHHIQPIYDMLERGKFKSLLLLSPFRLDHRYISLGKDLTDYQSKEDLLKDIRKWFKGYRLGLYLMEVGRCDEKVYPLNKDCEKISKDKYGVKKGSIKEAAKRLEEFYRKGNFSWFYFDYGGAGGPIIFDFIRSAQNARKYYFWGDPIFTQRLFDYIESFKVCKRRNKRERCPEILTSGSISWEYYYGRYGASYDSPIAEMKNFLREGKYELFIYKNSPFADIRHDFGWFNIQNSFESLTYGDLRKGSLREATDINDIHYIMGKVFADNNYIGVIVDRNIYDLKELLELIGAYHRVIDKYKHPNNDPVVNAIKKYLYDPQNEAELTLAKNGSWQFIKVKHFRAYCNENIRESCKLNINNPFDGGQALFIELRPRPIFEEDLNKGKKLTLKAPEKGCEDVYNKYYFKGIIPISIKNNSLINRCRAKFTIDKNFSGHRGIGLLVSCKDCKFYTEEEVEKLIGERLDSREAVERAMQNPSFPEATVVMNIGGWAYRFYVGKGQGDRRTLIVGKHAMTIYDPWRYDVVFKRINNKFLPIASMGRTRPGYFATNSELNIEVFLNPDSGFNSEIKIENIVALKEKGFSEINNPVIFVNDPDYGWAKFSFPNVKLSLEVEGKPYILIIKPVFNENNGKFEYIYEVISGNHKLITWGKPVIEGTLGKFPRVSQKATVSIDSADTYPIRADIRVYIKDDIDLDGIPTDGSFGVLPYPKPCKLGKPQDFCDDNEKDLYNPCQLLPPNPKACAKPLLTDVDIYIKDYKDDEGNTPAKIENYWDSPDIEVDKKKEMVSVMLRSRGKNPAKDVRVDIYVIQDQIPLPKLPQLWIAPGKPFYFWKFFHAEKDASSWTNKTKWKFAGRKKVGLIRGGANKKVRFKVSNIDFKKPFCVLAISSAKGDTVLMLNRDIDGIVKHENNIALKCYK